MSDKIVVCDIETDSLDPKYVWLIVCTDVETGEESIFERPDLNSKPFLDYASGVSKWIGHHFIKFDWARVLRRFFPTAIPRPTEQILDTLVCSRLFNFDVDGGHSLDAWATRLGLVKPKIADFTIGLCPEMIERCREDVKINLALFKRLRRHIESETYKRAVDIEHKMEFICLDMEEVGFPFNFEEAEKLLSEVQTRLKSLDDRILPLMKPKPELVREITPRLTQKGALNVQDFRWLEGGDLTPYSAGSTFSLINWRPFNPNSTSQLVERLNEAGWRPTEKTKGHIKLEREVRQCRDKAIRAKLLERLEEYKVYGWSVSEENLKTLPASAPEGIRLVAQRIVLASQERKLIEWVGLYRESTGSIHGRFQGIGAWTGRMAHQDPNMANAPSHPTMDDPSNPTPVEQIKLDYNMRMRSLWFAPKGYREVGVDADGIQLRILAHYMNDPEFTEALINGDKKVGTDAHSLNARKLGFEDWKANRDKAKTFIYAWLLGAGLDKIAQILYTTNKNEAKERVNQFVEGYPNLKILKEVQCKNDADRGYFVGLDGRFVPTPSQHHTLAGYLQNGEAIIMKTACYLWRKKLKSEGVWFRHVNFVHDEWQTITRDTDDEANYVAKVQMDAIVQAGVDLGLRCPLAGAPKIGYNWAECH